MEEQIRQVMQARVISEHLAVQHMREPCQGMPVRRVKCTKRPALVRRRKSAENMRIGGDVNRIIEIQELESTHRPIETCGSQCQQRIDKVFPPSLRSTEVRVQPGYSVKSTSP